MILVTGASGNVGGAALQAVSQTRVPVRAMYRSASDASSVPVGVETALADFADPASLRKALRGVNSVYLVCSPVPQLVELENNMINACADAGVSYIVLNSAAAASVWDKSFPSWHAQVEEHLQNSGIRHTILRPNSFMQNIPAYYGQTIQSQDAFYAAMGDSHVSFVDVEDIADVIAKLLTSTPRENSIYELHGPEAVTYAELAKRISRVSGRPIRYVDLPESELRKSMSGMGMPQWMVDALLDLQAYYRTGYGGESNDNIERITGHAPRTLNQFLIRNSDSFARQAATA